MNSKRLALFVSGKGSNAINLYDYFKDDSEVNVSLILTNNPHSPIIDFAKKNGIPLILLSNKEVGQAEILLEVCAKYEITHVVLAGYLRLIPKVFIDYYERKIINIHPALLPKFGGKGMYGMNVHEAVIESGDTLSGISIHLVDSNYDEGQPLATFYCTVENGDTAEKLSIKVQQLEHQYYPFVVKNSLF